MLTMLAPNPYLGRYVVPRKKLPLKYELPHNGDLESLKSDLSDARSALVHQSALLSVTQASERQDMYGRLKTEHAEKCAELNKQLRVLEIEYAAARALEAAKLAGVQRQQKKDKLQQLQYEVEQAEMFVRLREKEIAKAEATAKFVAEISDNEKKELARALEREARAAEQARLEASERAEARKARD
jgi:nitrate/nitrite-specific signal transduction histidine kinase